MISKSELIESRGLRIIEQAIVNADDRGHDNIYVELPDELLERAMTLLEKSGYGVYRQSMGIVIFWS